MKTDRLRVATPHSNARRDQLVDALVKLVEPTYVRKGSRPTLMSIGFPGVSAQQTAHFDGAATLALKAGRRHSACGFAGASAHGRVLPGAL